LLKQLRLTQLCLGKRDLLPFRTMLVSERDGSECTNAFSLGPATEQWLLAKQKLIWQIESLIDLLENESQATVQGILASHSPAVLHCCKVEQFASQKVELSHDFGSECVDDEEGRLAIESVSKRLEKSQASNSHGPDPCQNSLTWMAQEYAALPCHASVSDTTSKLWQSLCEGQHLDVKQDEVVITTAMLHNVPYKYTAAALAEELGALGMLDACDFLYLPVRGRGTLSGRNIGYAFVNLRSTCMFDKFAQAMHHYRFAQYTSASNPTAKVTRARIQGLAANLTTLVKQCQSDVPPSGLMLFDFDASVDEVCSAKHTAW